MDGCFTQGRKCCATPAFSGVPKQRGTTSQLVASPLPSRGPKRGQKCYVTPTISGTPKQRGTKAVAASRLPSRGPKRGRKCHVTPAFSGVPKERGKKKWLPHPCFLGGPKEGGSATSPLHSRRSQTPSAATKSEVAHRWAHRLQACIFSKIGKFFLQQGRVILIFVVNAWGKKSSHRVIFFCGKPCNFFLWEVLVTKKSSRRVVFFFVVMRVTGLHDLRQKKNFMSAHEAAPSARATAVVGLPSLLHFCTRPSAFRWPYAPRRSI